ncbi:MAG: putative S-adenosylmethionine-dependent methyltransferase [Planctomycetaceae bacterium]|nr:putative S-adenosylmethionine-dependent methyltransferase [Planctomycetaceae bacterium]
METVAKVATFENSSAQLSPDLIEAACPWCGDRRFTAIWPNTSATGFFLRRCAACDLAYTAPQLSSEKIAAYYSQAYYGAGNLRFNRLFETLVGYFRRRRAARLRQLHPDPGTVLDIGCGRGHFLQALRQQGWTCRGTELNETAARHAREILSLEVTIGPFDGAQYEDASFDAIYLWHVLEHIPATSQTLTEVRRMLRPGGMLVIAVPNLESWQAAWSRYHWFHLDLPRHYVHYSAHWLTTQLTTLGFHIAEVNHFSAEQNIYGWIQSLLNRAGLKSNLLYDMLRRPSARDVDRPWARFPVQAVLSLVGASVLLPFATLAMLVEALFRRGGTVEIYAQWLATTSAGPEARDDGNPPLSFPSSTSHPAATADTSSPPE